MLAPTIQAQDPTEPLLEEFSRAVNLPLLELGDVVVTPLYLGKLALFVAAVLVLASLTRRRLVHLMLRKRDIDEGVKFATARIASYVVLFIGVLIGLPMLGIQLHTIMVALGTLGLGIGLGLQKIAENFVSGLMVLVGRPVKVGDRVDIGGTVGTVVDIQIRVTLVRTNENVIILIPNAELISGRITNLTHNDKRVRFTFPIGVSYESDPNQVRDILIEVASKHPGVLEKPAPDVIFEGFGDSALNFILRAYTQTMVHVPEVFTGEMNFAIWYALKEKGITIPFPQRDLHLKTIPEGWKAQGKRPAA